MPGWTKEEVDGFNAQLIPSLLGIRDIIPRRDHIDVAPPHYGLDRVELAELGFEGGVPGDLARHVFELFGGVGGVGADEVEGGVLWGGRG